jgi:ribose transport system permease protein
MPKLRATQQTIVFILFLVMFGGFLLLLPGFAQVDNLLTLLQNVAILGILALALGMAVVVIGRGIDISMIAALAVPSGFLLQSVSNGQSIEAAALQALVLSLLFGLASVCTTG